VVGGLLQVGLEWFATGKQGKKKQDFFGTERRFLKRKALQNKANVQP